MTMHVHQITECFGKAVDMSTLIQGSGVFFKLSDWNGVSQQSYLKYNLYYPDWNTNDKKI